MRNQNRTAAIYSSEGYAGIAYCADWSAINFNGSNTLISGKFTVLEGVQAVDLTSAQKASLDDKETNAYYNVGGVPIVGEGTLGTNGWIDVQYWLDWVVEEVQREVLSFLRSSPRVPQTTKGLASLKRVIEGVCEQGRRNGGIAPGTLSEALVADVKSATGNDGFDGFLPQGYLVYVPPITTLSQTARDARQAPPFDVWFKGSGAINSVDIAMTFQN